MEVPVKIMFLCPKCHKKLEMDADASGHKVKCPSCGQDMLVPKRELHPGVTLGGFRIERKLGEGGMGEVFLARQTSMDRDVALKVLPAQLCRDKELVARFFSEVKVLARLEHPGIVTAHEAGEDGGMFFLAMAYVPGHSLQEQITKNGAFDEKTALVLLRKMAQALEYAWTDHKLLHRDIKPANVLLDAHGEPKLVDFGLAIHTDHSEGLTQSGTVIGTPNYMSPEHVQGEPALDFRADLYSLGATLYHMLTGKMPYAGSSLVETFHKQMSEPLPDPRSLNPGISLGCALLLQVMLAKKREQRYDSWKAFLADVDRVLAGHQPARAALNAGESVLLISGANRKGGGATGRASAAEPPRKDGGLAAAVVTGGVLLLAAAGLTIWALRRPAPETPAARQPGPVETALPVAPPVTVAAPPKAAPRKAAPVVAARDAAAKEEAALAAAQAKAALEAKTREAAEAAAREAAAKEEADKVAKLKAARDRLAAGLEEVAGLLLQPDLVRAREKSAALRTEPELAPLAVETEALAALMNRAADPDAAILHSFEQDKGETVQVEAKNGSIVEARVLGVSGGRVQTRQLMQGAMLERSLSPSDLSVRERLKRIGDEKTPESAIMRGLVLAGESGDWAKAGQAFSDAGPGLGEALAKNAQTKSASRDEFAAHQALGVILKTAALPADLNEPGRVMELLGEKRLSPDTQEKLRAGLESFLKTYGSSEAAGVARALAAGLSGDPEIVAKLALTSLLKKAGVKSDLEHPEALLEEIESRGFGKDAMKIQAAALAFKRDHGTSDIGRQNADLIGALAMAQEVAPAPDAPVAMVAATEENIKKALAALQAANRKAKGIADAIYRIEGNKITVEINRAEGLQDIRPLAGLPLKRLSMPRCEVENFAALAGMPLVALNMDGWNAGKIEAFPNLPELTYLNMGYSTLKSLIPLRHEKLKTFCGSYSSIAKLDGLERSPLEYLTIHESLVGDISLLAGKPLKSVSLGSSKATLIRDLTPLKDAPLVEFSLYDSRVKDLTPLAGKEIARLTLCNSPITDLKPMEGMPLRSVNMVSLDVTDLTPLKNPLLQRLEMENLPVKELKPLAGCPLSCLRIYKMPNLTDVQNIPDYFPDLVELVIHKSYVKPEMIKRLKSLKKLSVYSEENPDRAKAVPLDSFRK
jgi:serine/threonine-protein kinase